MAPPLPNDWQPPPPPEKPPELSAGGARLPGLSKATFKPIGKLGGMKLGVSKLSRPGKSAGIFAAASVADEEEPEKPPVARGPTRPTPGGGGLFLPTGEDSLSGSSTNLAALGSAPSTALSTAAAAACAAAAAIAHSINSAAAGPSTSGAVDLSAVAAAAASALTASVSAASASAAAAASGTTATGRPRRWGPPTAAAAAFAPAEFAGGADDDVDAEPSHCNYTFGRRYVHKRVAREKESSVGLRSIDCYENLGVVGRGAFNKIYKAKNRETGEIVALKAMQLASLGASGMLDTEEGVPLEMVREMSILMGLRHPNVVRVHEVVLDQSQMFMVMELVEYDLGHLIEHMTAPFTEGQVKCLALQLLCALSAVHESFTLHRDLKQTNLLLDRDGVLKLCDFGLSRRASGLPTAEPCTPDVQSLWYRAPEILLGERRYGTAVDVWSLGCIFAEWLQMGEPLFQGMSESDQINTVFRTLGTPSDRSWPGYTALPAVSSGLLNIADVQERRLGPDGSLVLLPKSSLRKKFPPEGCTAAAAAARPGTPRTTALSDAGFDLLSSFLTPDPAQRATAAASLHHAWFAAAPPATPLSRSEIRQLRRNREHAISSGAHQQALAMQQAQASIRVAADNAAAIAASIKERMGL